ncbi:unannotated protein [freshwater metagenome]|uniref:Unannotated protein n=1 Tax=freshwater metagenome TaxID=449393 RepID=A0A6J7C8W0_9ZZZZ
MHEAHILAPSVASGGKAGDQACVLEHIEMVSEQIGSDA